MKLLGKAARIVFALSLLAPATTFAAPIVYDISTSGSGGFPFSFMNSANEDDVDGFWLGGEFETSISGSLSIDWDDGTASGTITTSGDFGQDAGSWVMSITGGALGDGSDYFADNSPLLLSLDYDLQLDGSDFDAGTLFFADRNFSGAANTGGVGASEIYLVGNNWYNEFGDEKEFLSGPAFAIGIYGVASVPEPAPLLMLGLGLLGMAIKRRRKLA